MRILGFRPQTSPPQSLFALSGVKLSQLFSIEPFTKALSAVELHSCSEKDGSSNWRRSLTLTASPSLGFAGVVTKGNDERKSTYFLQRLEVNRLRITIICSSSNVSKVRSVLGTSGCSAGQCGKGTGGSGTFRFTFDPAFPVDFGPMISPLYNGELRIRKP